MACSAWSPPSSWRSDRGRRDGRRPMPDGFVRLVASIAPAQRSGPRGGAPRRRRHPVGGRARCASGRPVTCGDSRSTCACASAASNGRPHHLRQGGVRGPRVAATRGRRLGGRDQLAGVDRRAALPGLLRLAEHRPRRAAHRWPLCPARRRDRPRCRPGPPPRWPPTRRRGGCWARSIAPPWQPPPSSRPEARRGGAWRRRQPPACDAEGSASTGCC